MDISAKRIDGILSFCYDNVNDGGQCERYVNFLKMVKEW